MTPKAVEFIRRFLLHVLPSGFVRIRHYGFLVNRVCQEKLAMCRALLANVPTIDSAPIEPDAPSAVAVETNCNANVCPIMQLGVGW